MNKNPRMVTLLAVLACASLSCVTTEERMQPLKQLPAPRIDRLSPSMTLVGKGFQVQPSGDSAIVVTGSNFVSASRLQVNGRTLITTFGSSNGLTAIVPAEIYSQAGALKVTVENGDGQVSNGVLFEVLPAVGPAPQISRLRPDSCVVGQGFNVQPNGESAIAADGVNFVPGAVIYFDQSPLTTAFGNTGTLTATVPARLLRTPARVSVHVTNPDGKTSEAAAFVVALRAQQK